MKLWTQARVKSSGQIITITSYSANSSTQEEFVIGKWIDHKEMYMKTFNILELELL